MLASGNQPSSLHLEQGRPGVGTGEPWNMCNCFFGGLILTAGRQLSWPVPPVWWESWRCWRGWWATAEPRRKRSREPEAGETRACSGLSRRCSSTRSRWEPGLGGEVVNTVLPAVNSARHHVFDSHERWIGIEWCQQVKPLVWIAYLPSVHLKCFTDNFLTIPV